jgi:hypothetical protein
MIQLTRSTMKHTPAITQEEIARQSPAFVRALIQRGGHGQFRQF